MQHSSDKIGRLSVDVRLNPIGQFLDSLDTRRCHSAMSQRGLDRRPATVKDGRAEGVRWGVAAAELARPCP